MSCNSEEYNRYTSFCMRVKPEKDPWETDVHVHTVEELILIVSQGTCTVVSNGYTQQITTPAFIWNRMGSFHAMAQIDPQAEAYIACYHPQFLAEIPKKLLRDEFMDNCGMFALPLTEKQVERMHLLYKTLFTSPSSQRQLMFLCVLQQITQYLSSGSRGISLEYSNHYIFDVVNLLQHQGAERIIIPELAKRFHVGTTKLKKDFLRITALTIHAYQMQMRLQSARRLLARTDLPLLQIAIDCGFTDESHLIRAFRKDIGTTPGAYRNQHRAKWN